LSKKISFSIENADIINENPDSNFAVVKLDFFSSGNNLNDIYVSEETLLRTAETIKNCPLVWKMDETLDDAFTHDADEVPCGFVPDSSVIENKKLEDGRVMLSTVAYVWKKYTGDLLRILKRDKGVKPVSVEIIATKIKELKDGILELLDFKYEGITVLGSFVTPAIPSASMQVMSFSAIEKEYEEDYNKEFGASIDMKIPNEVKENAKLGLELAKEYGRGGSPTEIFLAQYIVENEEITEDKLERVLKYFYKLKGHKIHTNNPPSNDHIRWLLLGGGKGWKWAESTVSNINKRQNKEFSKMEITFPYKNRSEMNPALKGIEPPITVSQGNSIARQADAIGEDGEKNGWAIAIANFKKTHRVVDGKWVKKEKYAEENDYIPQGTELEKENLGKEEKEMGKTKKELELEKEMAKEEEVEEEEMASEEEKEEEVKEEEMASEEEDKEEMASEEEEEKEEKEEEEMVSEEEEEEEKEEEEMASENDVNMAVSEILEFFKTESSTYTEMGNDFGEKVLKIFEDFAVQAAKGEFDVSKEFAKMMNSYMKASVSKIQKLSKDLEESSNRVSELEEYKEKVIAEKFAFEVNSALAEAKEAGMPKKELDELLEESKEFSLENIDTFKNMVKAKAFVYISNQDGKLTKDEIVKIALPFTEEKIQPEQIWE
jgi:hypothetical protein